MFWVSQHPSSGVMHGTMSLEFWKIFKLSYFIKICRVGAELFHADGLTTRHNEADNRFSQFYERSQLRIAMLHALKTSAVYTHRSVLLPRSSCMIPKCILQLQAIFGLSMALDQHGRGLPPWRQFGRCARLIHTAPRALGCEFNRRSSR